MKIVIFNPVMLPPLHYGGAERVTLWLAEGLLELGNDVYIAALPGSRLPRGCKLIEVEKRHYLAEELSALMPKGVDIVHFMAPLKKEVWDNISFPAVLTVHGNGKEGEEFPRNTLFLSRDHATRHGGKAYVYNGVNPDEFLFNPRQRGRDYLFFSKTSWRVKNLKGAIRMCLKAQVPLKIAGGNRPFHARFRSFFSPSLTWLGSVSGRDKARVLSSARALIFPVIWPEPFGLVVVESLISGTPVIASPFGSLSELIPPHVGALPKSEEEWIEALQSIKNHGEPELCRQWALENFHYVQMAKNYHGFYLHVAGGNFIHDHNPSTLRVI
jgi:glycosyltransferase involved in cell wall biosynthesis